jgi:hypothetical protein
MPSITIQSMDQPSPPRRSLWRFSLRELLLLMLAIAAFLGWGRAIYQQRAKPFSRTPFLLEFKLHRELMAIREELKDNDFRWQPGSIGVGSSDGEGTESASHYAFALKPANRNALMTKLRERMHEKLLASGCKSDGVGFGSGGTNPQFHMRYERDNVRGSVRANLFEEGEQVRLFVFFEEHRK